MIQSLLQARRKTRTHQHVSLGSNIRSPFFSECIHLRLEAHDHSSSSHQHTLGLTPFVNKFLRLPQPTNRRSYSLKRLFKRLFRFRVGETQTFHSVPTEIIGSGGIKAQNVSKGAAQLGRTGDTPLGFYSISGVMQSVVMVPATVPRASRCQHRSCRRL